VSGITAALRGKSIIGLMDVRPIKYKNKSSHIAGLKYDEGQKTFFLTTPTKADSVNIGIFVSTYDIEVIHGKILAKEELTDVYELPSVSAKYERGGYDVEKGDIKEVFPKKVDVRILVLTSPDTIVIRNSKGFVYTCDFKVGKWFVMRPGTTLPSIYNMKDSDKIANNLLKVSLPFPALDRNIFNNKSSLEYGKEIDVEKHILDNV
jgi:hypothetical protein